MNTLLIDHDVCASAVSFSEEAMRVSLDDGRTISIPLAWYPRLHQRGRTHCGKAFFGVRVFPCPLAGKSNEG